MSPSSLGDPAGFAVLVAILVAVLLASSLWLWRARRAVSAILVDDETPRRRSASSPR